MKNFSFTLFVLLLIQFQGYSQGVGINNDNTDPDPSALLHVKSTTQGMLVPRMTSAQKLAIASPATGLIIFQTNGTSGFYYYDGSAWVFISAMDTNIYTTNGLLTGGRTVTQAGFPLSFTSTITNGFNVDGSTFSVDAANNCVGIGTTTPQEGLHVYQPNNSIASVYATGNDQGSGRFYAGQSIAYGGGFVYDGDGTPALIGGTDRITFFRRNNGTDEEVLSYAYNNSTLRVTNLAGTGNRMVVATALGDLTTQALPAGDNLGNHVATTNLNMSNLEVDNVNYLDFRPGNGYGVRFWSSDSYAINMGNSPEYAYGPVTSYSIKSHMNNDPARGWTWGVDGATPVAALNTQGAMQIQGSLKVSNNNATGGGLILADDGGIFDRNDGYASMAFSLGVDFEDSQDNGDHLRLEFNDGYPEFWGYRNDAVTLVEFRTGMYNNGGTFYSQNQIYSRTGIANDGAANGGNLTLNDGVYVTGNVGIREVTPIADLHIQQSGGSGTAQGTGGLNLESGTYHWRIYNSNNYVRYNYSTDGGATYTAKAYVLPTDGSWNQVSDASMKHNLENMGAVLPSVMKLNALKYHYLDNQPEDAKALGFLAQDVQKIFPETVSHEKGETLLGIDYSKFAVISIKAIQEQQKTIETLQKEVEELKVLIKAGK